MPAVVKKKRSNDSLARFKKYQAEVEERYQYALEIKNQQDDETVVAINRMVARMQAMAPPPIFYVNGIAMKIAEDEAKSVQIKSLTWIAVRLMVACAEWEIRIANFKPPTKKCAKCGKKVK